MRDSDSITDGKSDDPRESTTLGDLYCREGRYEEALHQYALAVEADPCNRET